jgi:HD superfamily phosphodiesterase
MYPNTNITKWAAEQAYALLAPLENRWKHTQGVVKRAHEISKLFNGSDRSLLIAAAYLHDIGYAPSLKRTGYHSIDGAYYLRANGQERLASLVAHHFEAYTVARQLGLMAELEKFPAEYSAIANALDYCDLTTNSVGEPISFQERIDDILQRHKDDRIITQATREAIPALRAAYERIQAALHGHGK